MGMEIEAKMRLTDRLGMIGRIRQAGGTLAEERLECNIFMDTPGAALRKTDCGLRVRRETPTDGSGPSRVIITHKGPRLPGPLKQRVETELRAEDAEASVALLTALGFVETVRFDKRRQSWRLEGCSIELDELPRIGSFIEIEGPDEATVMSVREKLGLSDEPMIRESYAAMVHAYLNEQPAGSRTLTF